MVVYANSWTDQDAVCVEDFDGPREPYIRWGSRYPYQKGQFWRKEEPIVSIGTFCRELCKNGWTNRFAIWIVDLGGPKEAEVQLFLPGGANVPTWEGTLASRGEHDWTIRLWRQCSVMSNYFDRLLLLLSLLLLILQVLQTECWWWVVCIGRLALMSADWMLFTNEPNSWFSQPWHLCEIEYLPWKWHPSMEFVIFSEFQPILSRFWGHLKFVITDFVVHCIPVCTVLGIYNMIGNTLCALKSWWIAGLICCMEPRTKKVTEKN